MLLYNSIYAFTVFFVHMYNCILPFTAIAALLTAPRSFLRSAWEREKSFFTFLLDRKKWRTLTSTVGEGSGACAPKKIFQTRGSAQGRDGRGGKGWGQFSLAHEREEEKFYFFLVTVVSFPFLRYKNNPVSWCVCGAEGRAATENPTKPIGPGPPFCGYFFLFSSFFFFFLSISL